MQHTDNQTIISISPSATNTLFELKAEEKIIACTEQNTLLHPIYHTKQKIGTANKLELETIKSLNPHLIIASATENTPQQIQDLQEMGFELFVLGGKKLSEVYQSIGNLGEEISRRTQAAKLTSKIDYQLSAFAEKIKQYKEIQTAFFTNNNPYSVAAEHSLIDQLLRLNKLENIYCDIPKENAELQLATLKILDPQLILLPDNPIEFTDEDALEMGKYTEHALTVFVPGDIFCAGAGLLSLPKFFEQLNIKMRREQTDDLTNRSTETFF